MSGHVRRGLAVLLLVGALTGCSSASGLHTRVGVGTGQRHIDIVIDDNARRAFAGAISSYWRHKHIRVIVRSGTSTAIAQAVKYGSIVDLVVVTGGPPLTRVRDELAAPAFALGTYHGVGYWAAAITDIGIHYVSFLRSRLGVHALRAGGFTV